MSALDLDWPIDGLEPLSFVLTRLLEPLSTRLERQDRGAAVLHVELGLVTPDAIHARHLQLPSPIRDVRTLRTLALLDLDAHPPRRPSIASPSSSIRRRAACCSTRCSRARTRRPISCRRFSRGSAR